MADLQQYKRIAELLCGEANGSLTPAQYDELKRWLKESASHELFQQEVKSSRSLLQDIVELQPGILENSETKTWTRINTQMNVVQPVHRVHFLRTAWFRVAVAVLIILTGAIIYNQFSRDAKNGGSHTKSGEALAKADILPGNNKAVLILSDGREIELNDGASGVINDGELLIKNNDGQLNYGQVEGATHPAAGAGSDYAQDARTRQHPSEGGDWRASYNTMSTPRGGQYKLVLPDGSKVWLNAESSITFPTSFAAGTREVKISGEAYFEIKADKTRPFIVKTISDEIQVLGTSFNINAYNDAPVKTSLLEGSIKIKSSILKPGQAFINGKIITTNLQQDIAWKNGIFNFNNLPFELAMSQFARWYDVNVVYDNGIPDEKIRGEMGRDLTLRQALEGLDGTVAGFKLEGRTVHVIAYK